MPTPEGFSDTTSDPSLVAPPLLDPIQSQRPFGTRRKMLIIFSAALLGSAVVQITVGTPRRDVAFAIGEVVGRALMCFVAAMLVAGFIRDRRGAVVGVGLVVLMTVALGVQQYGATRRALRSSLSSTREPLAALHAREKALFEAEKSALQQTGHADVPASVVRTYLADTVKDFQASSDPQTTSAIEGIVKVTTRLLQPAERMQSSLAEINTKQFLQARTVQSRDDLEQRIEKVNAYRACAAELLDLAEHIGEHIQAELTARKLPANDIAEGISGYQRGAHLSLILRLYRLNVEYADMLLGKFGLLKEKYGAWQMQEETVMFEDGSAVKRWNAYAQRLAQITKEQSELQNQAMEARGKEMSR